ncbi:disulfide bond formation protein B [Pelagibaculum spongiae]|nr:disulfide bond formation protein B [Pelagibaculum spongiae]
MIKISENHFYNVIALAILVLGGGVFTATFVEQLFLGDMPCASCLITRQLILLVTMVACMVLRYGPQPKFVGLLLIIAVIDMYVGLRHSTFHWFAYEGTEGRIMGIHMYVWGIFMQMGVITMIGVLLTALPKVFDFCALVPAAGRALNWLQKSALWLTLLLVVANLVLSFALVGPPPLKAPWPPVYWGWLETGWNW